MNRAPRPAPGNGRLVACVAAWLLGLIPLTMPVALVGPAPRFALVALIWAALLGLPRCTGGSRVGRPGARPPAESGAADASASARAHGSPAVRVVTCLALALPELALAGGLDGAAFAGPDLGRALFALALVGGLALAAELAARRGGPAYAAAWGALVAGAPLLASALALGGVGAPPEWLVRIAAASPLAWIASASDELAWGPALVTLVVLSVPLATTRPAA